MKKFVIILFWGICTIVTIKLIMATTKPTIDTGLAIIGMVLFASTSSATFLLLNFPKKILSFDKFIAIHLMSLGAGTAMLLFVFGLAGETSHTLKGVILFMLSTKLFFATMKGVSGCNIITNKKV